MGNYPVFPRCWYGADCPDSRWIRWKPSKLDTHGSSGIFWSTYQRTARIQPPQNSQARSEEDSGGMDCSVIRFRHKVRWNPGEARTLNRICHSLNPVFTWNLEDRSTESRGSNTGKRLSKFITRSYIGSISLLLWKHCIWRPSEPSHL